MKTLIVGLGNPILSDDGVGVKVAYCLRKRLLTHPDLTIKEASAGGLRLLEMALGYDRVVLVDAICRKGGLPGVFSRLCLKDIAAMAPTQNLASAHDTSLTTAVEMGKRMGLDLPHEWIIYAVNVTHIDAFDDRLTAAVSRAVPRLVDTILKDL